MAVRTNGARYVALILWVRFMALNDDLTIPTPDRVAGGVGPFDFSGFATPAAVPFSVKLDNAVVQTLSLNLTGLPVADITAVTVAEIVAAIAAAGGFTDVTVSVEAVTGRLLVEYSGTEAITVMQVYGAGALLSRIGQGRGCQFIKSNTIQSINVVPVRKDEERIPITDALGKDTELVTDGYRKGFTATIVDTAEDINLISLTEGGIIDANGEYTDPTSESEKIYFYIEAFYGLYSEGENKEADMVAVRRELYQSCKGAEGDANHAREWKTTTYNITGTSYRDENDVISGASKRKELTIVQWETLDVVNV